MKICPHCHERKPARDYYVNRSKKDGIGTYCRICVKEAKGATPSRELAPVKPHHLDLLLGNSREFLAMASRPIV